MTQDIIEMAAESGWVWSCLSKDQQGCILYFAKLVEDKASAKEREACANVCEEIEKRSEGCDDAPAYRYYEAIRARGEQQ